MTRRATAGRLRRVIASGDRRAAELRLAPSRRRRLRAVGARAEEEFWDEEPAAAVEEPFERGEPFDGRRARRRHRRR